MSTASFLQGVDGTGQTNQQTNFNSPNNLDPEKQQENFMQILLAQLQNQNPMEPLKNKDFVNQMSQLTSLQQSTEMNESIQSFIKQQKSNQYMSLLGSRVTAKTNSGKEITGLVEKVSFLDGKSELQIGGETVKSTNLSAIGLAGTGSS